VRRTFERGSGGQARNHWPLEGDRVDLVMTNEAV
jgi:hypothetical protein